MAISKALQNWAKGMSKDAESSDDVEAEAYDEGEEGEETGEVEPLEDGDRNLFWAGEAEASAIEEATDEDLASLADWMADHEPDVWAAALALADAVAESDLAEADVAEEQFLAAEQYLVPEYPALNVAQRTEIADAIREYAADLDPPFAAATAVMECRAELGGDDDGEPAEDEAKEETDEVEEEDEVEAA